MNKIKKGMLGMSNNWRFMTLIFALILISVSYVLIGFAATSAGNYNAAAQNVTASESDFLAMDFNLTVGNDTTLGGQTPTAAAQVISDIDANWTNIYLYDSAAGWSAAADMLFVDNGNRYYDDSLDTPVVGITVENTGPGNTTEPDDWNLFYRDAAGGGQFVIGNDWIGTDDDSDGNYTSAPDTLADANGATTLGTGTTSLVAGTALTAMGDDIGHGTVAVCTNNLGTPTAVRIDTNGDCSDGTTKEGTYVRDAAATNSTAQVQTVAQANFATNNNATSEVTRVTAVADVSASLEGKYFNLSNTTAVICFWINESGTGTTPANCTGAGKIVEITTIAANDSANTVAGKITTVINAEDSLTAVNTGAPSAIVDVTVDTAGVVANGVAGDSGFTVDVTTPGEDLTTADYFTLEDFSGQHWRLWFDRAGNGEGQPANHADGNALTKIDISGATTAAQVQALITTAVDGLASFSAVVNGDDNTNTTVTLTTGGVSGNTRTNSENVANAGFIILNFGGGDSTAAATETTNAWAFEDTNIDANYDAGEDIFIENAAGELTYSAAADTKIAGANPTAGNALTTSKPGDWSQLNFFDAATGASWNVTADSIWTNDGNVYYDVGIDTHLAGITTENTQGTAAIGNEPAAWYLASVDTVDNDNWNASADSIVLDADNNNFYLDRLNAVVVNLTSTSTIVYTSISNITLWKDAGGAGYQGSGTDTVLGTAPTLTSYIPNVGWNVSGLTTALTAGENRFFITVSLAGSATSGQLIKFTVDAKSDQGADNVYQQGDNGIFLASNLVLDQLTNANFQTVDADAPSVVLSDNHADSVVRDADTVAITATFTDNGDIYETAPPTITVIYGGGCANITNDATVKSSNTVWTYSWNVPAACDGSVAVSITATDVAGNPNTAATGQTSYIIDNTAPLVSNVTSVSPDAFYNLSTTFNLTVQFDSPMVVTGTPLLELGMTSGNKNATYLSGSGTTELVFNYTVELNDLSADLTFASNESLRLNSGSIKDVAGNDASLNLTSPAAFSAAHAIVVDADVPEVEFVSSDTVDDYYNASKVIDIKVVFNATVTVTGAPQIELETGTTDRFAVYSSGSGSTTLHFNYTVQAGDTAGDLTYKATDSLSLNGGTILDAASNGATLTLPNLTVFSLAHAIQIDTTAPTISAVDPATGAYLNFMGVNYTLSGAVDWGTITFTRTGGNADGTTHTCTLSGSAKNTGAHSDLVLENGVDACSGWTDLVDNVVYTAVFVANDSAGNIATPVTSTSVTYDVTGPLVVLTDNHVDSIVRDADTVVITATFTENYTINTTTGIAPRITLEGPGACDISDAAMTNSTNLIWTYSWNVPAACDGTVDVSIAAQDLAGNANSVATGQTSYTIDNTAPTFDSWSLNMNSGLITMNFNEAANPASLTATAITIQDKALKTLTPFTLSGGTASSPNGTQVNVTLTAYDLNLLKSRSYLAKSNATSFAVITSSAMTDVAGNPVTAIADGSALIATTYTADSTAPTASSMSPGNGTSVLSTSTAPVITFSEIVDTNTISNSSVKLYTYSGDTLVPSIVTTNSDGNSATNAIITPHDPLTAGTQYYIVVTSSVKDVFGNSVAATWNSTNKGDHSFTTVNTNYTQSLSTKWNTLWIPHQSVLESTGRTAGNTGNFNFTSILSSLGTNWNYMYYNLDGTSSGWALAIRNDFTGSTLKYVNNTNDSPYWINMTAVTTFTL